jgi:hypothetical protein
MRKTLDLLERADRLLEGPQQLVALLVGVVGAQPGEHRSPLVGWAGSIERQPPMRKSMR